MTKVSSKTAKRILRFYWQRASAYPAYLVVLAIFAPIAIIFSNTLAPLVLARVLQRLSTGDYALGEPWESFGSDIIIYLAITLSANLVLWRIVDMTVWKLEGKIQKDLAQIVYSHLIDQSADFHANHFGGSLVSQNNKFLSSYIRIADTTVFGVLPLTITTISAAVILFSRTPIVSVSLILFAIIYIAVSLKVSAPVRRRGAKHASQESKQTGYLADSITNAMAIKSFAGESNEKNIFSATTERTRGTLLKLMSSHQKQMLYFGSMSSMITAGSLALAVVSVVNFRADIAIVFLIFNYTTNIVSQLFTFSNQSLRNYNRAIGDASEMMTILDTNPEVIDPAKPEDGAIHRGSIKFENVSFAHKGADDAIFKNLSLHIKTGEKVGLVGHSGSGKTTFTRLLLRFSDVQKGRITIDGQNIAKITQNDLRRAIAYVPQEPLLFHRTIAENIGYSNPDAPPDTISAVARQANAAEFIEKLPTGYETLVGERGIKLSGGQRQRIAIARAMLKNAPILVLDEATSALDSESEGLIQDALWKLMEGRTAIVIAHRLSTIQRMDRIIVMDKGKIVEEGTHKELARKGGVYAKLWEKQSGGFLEE